MLFWVTNAHKVRKRRTLWKKLPCKSLSSYILNKGNKDLKEISTRKIASIVSTLIFVLRENCIYFTQLILSSFFTHWKIPFSQKNKCFPTRSELMKKVMILKYIDRCRRPVAKEVYSRQACTLALCTPIGGILEKISIRDQEEINIPCISKAIFPVLDNYM